MALIKVIKYFHKCDACGKEIPSDGNDPETGTIIQLTFPNSAYGQRKTYTRYSCKEQSAHVAKAVRSIIEKREVDIQGRKNRGEQYSASKD